MNGCNSVVVKCLWYVLLFGCDLVDVVQSRPVHYAIGSRLGLAI